VLPLRRITWAPAAASLRGLAKFGGTDWGVRASNGVMFAMSVPGMLLLAVTVAVLMGAIAWLLPAGEQRDRPQG
jgi:hypothetical protein